MGSQRPLPRPHLHLLLCSPASARLLPRLTPHPQHRTFSGSLKDAHCSAPAPPIKASPGLKVGRASLWSPRLLRIFVALANEPLGSISLSGHLSVRALPRGQCDWALSLLAPPGARRQEHSPLISPGGLCLPHSLQEWTSAVCVYVSMRARAYMCGHVCSAHGCTPVFSGVPALRAAERLWPHLRALADLPLGLQTSLSSLF